MAWYSRFLVSQRRRQQKKLSSQVEDQSNAAVAPSRPPPKRPSSSSYHHTLAQNFRAPSTPNTLPISPPSQPHKIPRVLKAPEKIPVLRHRKKIARESRPKIRNMKTQSLLLTKFPLEIRRLIYRYVLGEHQVIHILLHASSDRSQPDTLGYVYHEEPEEEHLFASLWCGNRPSPDRIGGLLRTCWTV